MYQTKDTEGRKIIFMIKQDIVTSITNFERSSNDGGMGL